MHRYYPGPVALAGAHSQCWWFGIEIERSETTRSSASAMRRPALHCSSMSSLALGLSVALMIAPTSWAFRYSSFLVWVELPDLLGECPADVVFVPPSGLSWCCRALQEVLREIL